MRVVSLLPSATETLCLIGGGPMLVARSHECDWPAEVRDLPALTTQRIDPSWPADRIDQEVAGALAQGLSLYRLDEARLHALAPDLILTQDLCEVCSIDLGTVRAAAARMPTPPAVVALNPTTFEGVLDDLLLVGRATGREREAREALVALRERFFAAADYVNAFDATPSVAFIEWADPIFVGGHWTPQLIERAGGLHPLNPTRPMEGAGAGAGGQMAHRVAGKSIRVTPQQLIESDPDHIIICPCGVGLDDIPRHMAPLQQQEWWPRLKAVRQGRVALVDGNHFFNRPGPRLVDAYCWLVAWLNDRPQLTPPGFLWRAG